MTGEKSWSDWQRERHKVLPLLDIGHSLAGSFPVRHGKTHPRGMPPLELFPECLIFADTLKFFLIWPCLEPLMRGWGGLNFNFQWHGGEGIFDKIISHSIWVCRFLHHRHPNFIFKTSSQQPIVSIISISIWICTSRPPTTPPPPSCLTRSSTRRRKCKSSSWKQSYGWSCCFRWSWSYNNFSWLYFPQKNIDLLTTNLTFPFSCSLSRPQIQVCILE